MALGARDERARRHHPAPLGLLALDRSRSGSCLLHLLIPLVLDILAIIQPLIRGALLLILRLAARFEALFTRHEPLSLQRLCTS